MSWTGRIVRIAAVAALVAGTGALGVSPAGAAVGDIDRLAGLAGNPGFSGDGGPGTDAQLNGPSGVAHGPDGRVYIADRQNDRVRVVEPDGTISTLASGLVKPVDVAVSPDGAYLYVAEDGDPFVNQIRRIDLAGPGSSTVIAGGASSGYGGDGGPATGAVFWGIAGIDVGPDGDVFIADQRNNRIRRIDVDTGTISLVAGTGAGGGDDGPVLSATFANPKDVAVDPTGQYVYVADEGTNNIRRIDLVAGTVSVFAGSYAPGFAGDGGPAGAAQLWSPDGVAVAPNGDVYIADTSNNRVRRVDIATGTITTVAGNGGCCGGGDGGPATAATIGNPMRLSVDAAGWIWIAAEAEHTVRVVEGAVVPGPPLDLTATRTDAGVALTWSPPASDGGAPIIEYVVYRDGVEIGRTASLAFTDADAPTTAATYEVAAVNVAGTGPRSEPAEIAAAPEEPTTTTSEPGVPAAPPASPVTATPTFVG